MRARRHILVAAAATALLASLPLAARATVANCSAPDSAAGEWPSYGHDLLNTRSQPLEDTIGITNANSLKAVFVHGARPGEMGTINSTPIVAGGCVFINTAASSTQARVSALDAESGTEVWSTIIHIGQAAYPGSAVGAPALHGDLLILPVNRLAGPFAVALDRDTGDTVWTSGAIDNQPDSGINASVTVYDGVVFLGFFGKAGPWKEERGGFALLDATTGVLLKKTFTIPDEDFAEKYAGAGIWGTAAVDEATGFAYVGTSNPHNPQKIHERSTSLLKIDLNRASGTFGDIVDFYQGLRDTVVPDAEKQPACEMAPGVNYAGNFSATCLAIDIDFGASPNLIKLDDGRTLLGGQQKSGTYHVVDTDGMNGVSMTQAGVPCFACSAGSTAYAGGRAFVPAGPPGQMVAVDVATLGQGVPVWASPIGGGFTFNPASTANGLVWMTDSGGYLNAFDQLTGAIVLKRPLQLDTGTSMVTATSSAGVAIARNTVYAALGSYLVAYRLPVS